MSISRVSVHLTVREVVLDNLALHTRTGNSPTALVVEDNDDLRELVCDVLKDAGYATCGIATAEEGIQLLQYGNFDVMIVDVCLPGMSGLELVGKARQIDPGIKVILATGQGISSQLEQKLGFNLLKKPYSISDLQNALTEA